jgi:hypothetical protein
MNSTKPTPHARALDAAKQLTDTAPHARGQTVGQRRRRSGGSRRTPSFGRSSAVHEWLTFVARLLAHAARMDAVAQHAT